MADKLGLKLLTLKISDCSSEGELKSVFKEVTSRNDSEDDLKLIVSSIKAQLSSDCRTNKNKEEIVNVLTFIKSLAETQPQFGIQKLDDLLRNSVDDSSQLPQAVSSSPSSPQTSADFIYEYIIEPLLVDLWDHINLILNNDCKPYIQNLSATAATEGASTHELLVLVHKLVQTTLSLLKRIDSAGQGASEELRIRLLSFGEVICELMLDSKFNLSLDIRCNMGLSLCYLIRILSKDSCKYFANLFSQNRVQETENGLSKRVFEVSCDDLNRIALAFGVLGTTTLKDEGFIEAMIELGANILTIDHGTKESTNLGSARVLEIWTDKLSFAGKDALQQVSPLFGEIEFFIFSYLPGHIDAVKTCCRYMLGNLTRIYEKLEENGSELVRTLLKKIMVKPLHIKWIGLACVSRNSEKAVYILEEEVGMPETLLCCQRTSSNPCTETYLSLMGYQFSKVSESEWETTWIDPLFKNQQNGNIESNWPQKRVIVSSILKGRSEGMKEAILKSVMQRMNASLLSCNESLLLAVEAIKIATDLEIKLHNLDDNIAVKDSNSFRGIVTREGLHSWLYSGDPQIRLSAFSLLVDTKKTSELIPPADYESLKLLFRYSFTSQNPAFRQQFLAYFKKLLKRLRDGQRKVVRDKDSENIKNYKDFLHWLWKFLTKDEGLFPGSNFGRRCQALECLSELTIYFDMDSLGVQPCPQNLDYIRWLQDTYEYNKIKILGILSKIPMYELEFDSDSPIAAQILQDAFDLCESVKPPNSLTGRYLIVFLIKKCHQFDNAKYSAWTILTSILTKLQTIFDKVINSSLIEVAAQTPMYGYIRCIRMIFDETQEYLIHWERYRKYSKDLIDLCFKLNEILFPVLGSAAPEGFLPGLPDSQPQNSKVVRSINAQMLLVCSWRSMKDICLLLTEMCKFPLEGETDKYILTYDQVFAIGEHLLYLLKNLMHRGVFEQVYIGFKQLAARLYKSTSQKLNELPELWLNSAMDEELVNSKCITRRSAGLPFIFQALLSPVCSSEGFVSKYVNRLLIMDPTSAPTVRIHAMNILRALFRDATFSRAMMPYVPAGLRLAFNGLKAADWTERNSGLMLFGALIRRTFGPKMNLMSAPSFFRKFPKMYDFLLSEITACSKGLEAKGPLVIADFTYHVLILLSSFASNGVVEDRHFQLVEFISPIRECAGSADAQVRKVAAKALIPFLIDPMDKVHLILLILDNLKSDCDYGINKIHGNLVQVLTILETIPPDSHIQIISYFNEFISKSTIWSTESPTIFQVLFDICVALGEGTRSTFKVIRANFESIFAKINDRRAVPGLPYADIRLATADVFFALSEERNTECVYNWIMTRNLMFLEVLLGYLLEDNIKRTTEEMSLILYAAVKRYLKESFSPQSLSSAEEMFLALISKISVKVFNDWATFVEEEDFVLFFQHLLCLCECEGGKIECKTYALIILGNMALKTENIILETHPLDRFCDILTLSCDSNLNDDIRLAASKSIPKLPLKTSSFTVQQQLKIWYSLLTLAQDDEVSVRAEISRKVGHQELCERKSLEVLVKLFLTEFASVHVLEALVLLLGLLLRDDFEIRAEEADDGEEDRLFDKSEMNSFNEPILLAKVLEHELETQNELVNQMVTSFNRPELTPDLVEFFLFVSNSTLPSDMKIREVTTLKSLCDIVSEKLTTYDQSSDKYAVLKWIREFVLNCFGPALCSELIP